MRVSFYITLYFVYCWIDLSLVSKVLALSYLFFYYEVECIIKICAEMSERSIVPSWKGGVVKATSGSNPDLCAIKNIGGMYVK